jgi:4-amino-4-deoxy-L-arabinose transferase-like glycosyltransferase
LLLVNLAGILLLYRVARRFLDVPGAAVAAASYALLSMSPVVVGLAAHATQFVVVAALAGLLLLLRGEETGKPMLFFCSGLLFGVACLIKQPGAVFGLFGFSLLAVQTVRERRQWSRHWQRIAFFVTGGAVPLLLTALILWQAGVFGRFWFWTFIYAREHAAEFPLSAGLRYLAGFLKYAFSVPDGLFSIAAGLGFVSLFLVKVEQRKKFWLPGLFAFSCVAVALSNYFTNHYFVMLLPALSLFVGQAVDAAMQWIRTRNVAGAWLALPAGCFALMGTLMVFHYRSIFFVLGPDQVCALVYQPNSFLECRQIGHYLGEHSSADARIAVLGSEPEILFYARRHSATGYIYMYDFFKPQPHAAEMQREMIAQIEEARPEYLVFVMNPVSWYLQTDARRAGDDAVVNWFPKFAKDFYEPDGLVITKRDPEYHWGRDALNQPPFRGPFISIFRRK